MHLHSSGAGGGGGGSSILFRLLLLLHYFSMAALLFRVASCNFDFDLNQLPEEYDPDNKELHDALAAKTRQRMTPQHYAKIERLFKVLHICDTDQFDLRLVTIPNSFTAENKAMMALAKVAKLIKRRDKERYKRVMVNCYKVAHAVQDRLERQMGEFVNQESGGDYSFMDN